MSAVRLAGVRQPFTPNKYRHVPEILRVRRARGRVGQPGIVNTTVAGPLVRVEQNAGSGQMAVPGVGAGGRFHSSFQPGVTQQSRDAMKNFLITRDNLGLRLNRGLPSLLFRASSARSFA
jgi:hypothetical protein